MKENKIILTHTSYDTYCENINIYTLREETGKIGDTQENPTDKHTCSTTVHVHKYRYHWTCCMKKKKVFIQSRRVHGHKTQVYIEQCHHVYKYFTNEYK